MQINTLEEVLKENKVPLPSESDLDVSVVAETTEDLKKAISGINMGETGTDASVFVSELNEKNNLIMIQDEQIGDLKLRLQMNEDMVEAIMGEKEELIGKFEQIENSLEEEAKLRETLSKAKIELETKFSELEEEFNEIKAENDSLTAELTVLRKSAVKAENKEEFAKISEKEYLEQIVNSHRVILEMKARMDCLEGERLKEEQEFNTRLDEREEIIEQLREDLTKMKERNEDLNNKMLAELGASPMKTTRIIRKIRGRQSSNWKKNLARNQTVLLGREELSMFASEPASSAFNLLRKFNSKDV